MRRSPSLVRARASLSPMRRARLSARVNSMRAWSGLAGGEEGFAEAVERQSFTGRVADLAEQVQRLLMVARALLRTALPQMDVAQVGERVSLGRPVAGLAA